RVVMVQWRGWCGLHEYGQGFESGQDYRVKLCCSFLFFSFLKISFFCNFFFLAFFGSRNSTLSYILAYGVVGLGLGFSV
uniref:Uncharacterized protein n=1 Tax=Amphimedon queenslandica TaxID=400682 RepID=A0A1X7TU27_AMPQE